jgi:hypothetical protein
MTRRCVGSIWTWATSRSGRSGGSGRADGFVVLLVLVLAPALNPDVAALTLIQPYSPLLSLSPLLFVPPESPSPESPSHLNHPLFSSSLRRSRHTDHAKQYRVSRSLISNASLTHRRYHTKALRSVAYHPTLPLFASSSDDGTDGVCRPDAEPADRPAQDPPRAQGHRGPRRARPEVAPRETVVGQLGVGWGGEVVVLVRDWVAVRWPRAPPHWRRYGVLAVPRQVTVRGDERREQRRRGGGRGPEHCMIRRMKLSHRLSRVIRSSQGSR